jgi:hypothetical protein
VTGCVVVRVGHSQTNERTSERAPRLPRPSSGVTAQKYVLPGASVPGRFSTVPAVVTAPRPMAGCDSVSSVPTMTS